MTIYDILVLIILAGAVWIIWTQAIGAEWLPTRMRTVRRMLELANVGPDDMVYDLGSGDGRIIITAAREFGARATGIEADPIRMWWSRLRIRRRGVADRVAVEWGNFFKKDISDASVVTLYLYQSTNDRLVEKLERELKPGTRIVSYVFIFKSWDLVAMDEKHSVYLYKIGEKEGTELSTETP